MSIHDRCEFNCGGTACDAPVRPQRKDGPAINLDYYAGSYGGTTPTKSSRQINPWLVYAVALCAANLIGWAAWALWHTLDG